MKNEVSVFIMSVSNSSKEDIGHELSEYLEQLQISIAYWTQYIVPTKVTHRGDELIVVCSGYATAYTLAFYLSRIWKFADHQPHFGLSFGNTQEDVNAINIKTWIDPLLKQARLAIDSLNKRPNRMQFYFQLSDSAESSSFGIYSRQFETLLNTSLALQQEQMNDQTKIQSIVSSLYFMLGKQNKVSDYLGRTTSTVSTHMKNGKTAVILTAFHNIVDVLNSLAVEQTDGRIDELQMNIRQNITQRLHHYFPNEIKSI